MVRWLRTWAFGRCDVVGCRSTRRWSTPRSERKIDDARPQPPPPTIRTGTAMAGMVSLPFGQRLEVLGFGRYRRRTPRGVAAPRPPPARRGGAFGAVAATATTAVR